MGRYRWPGHMQLERRVSDNWLPACIASYSASPAPSLSGFANHLASQLESSSTPDKARLFHIAGYVDDANGVHPEFYFVRNIQGINASTGDYEGVTSKYQVTEDFWTRDYPHAPAGMFAAGGSQRYFNGLPSGRIAYLGAMQKLQEFYEQVWREPNWKFRRPVSLDELAAFVQLELETINTLFTSSDYPTPTSVGPSRSSRSLHPQVQGACSGLRIESSSLCVVK